MVAAPRRDRCGVGRYWTGTLAALTTSRQRSRHVVHLVLAGALIWVAAPVALFIGTVGAISVINAVYIEKRELKCACVGGSSKVPLGFVSLTENLMMVAMAIWMPVRMYWLG